MPRNETLQLSTAQYEIMDIVWERGEATVNQVLQAIIKRRREKLRRTTIQVQMSRLEKKGWLDHRTVGRTYWFRALRSREEASAAMAGELTNRVFNGSCADLVKCLFDHEKISDEEIRRLRSVLDRIKGE